MKKKVNFLRKANKNMSESKKDLFMKMLFGSRVFGKGESLFLFISKFISLKATGSSVVDNSKVWSMAYLIRCWAEESQRSMARIK